MSTREQQYRGQHTRRLVLAAMFAGAATVLGVISFPVGPTKVFPFQHTINAIAGIWLGPWYSAGAALVTATLRYLMHTGSIFAFPGSPFGALAVGLAYRIFRNDAAALCEPIGTGLLGATLAALFFQTGRGPHHTVWWFEIAFLASSIPGAVLGYAVVRMLRRVPQIAGWSAAAVR
jgi:energy coupling factor transporter S component ThiW